MHKLERLLRPRTIAVFGGAQAAAVVAQSIKMGFAGAIWPVHPTKDEVAGRKAYRSVADLPGAPDAAFVGVNRHSTIEVVKALAERGAGGAVCFAAGFLETEAYDEHGERLQAELVAAAGQMPIIGPNCYGLINYADGALLWPDQHGGIRLAEGGRGVAIITQSSNIAINMTMQKRGLPIAFLMTAGNQAQTGLSEMAIGLIEDDRVTSLGLHIEAFDSVAGFERLAARARELKKPIIAMKVGRSEQARQATVSHTASLAGSDAASGAFLKRLGIARVDSIPAFIEALKLLHVTGPLPGYRLSSMSCSGGEASVMADSAEGRWVNFPALTDTHRAHVKSTLGPLVAVANPLDYHTFIWNNEPAMTATFTAMVSGGFDLNMLVLDFPRPDRCSDTDWWTTLRAFESALKTNKAQGAIVSSLPENLPEEYTAGLMGRGMVPLFGISEAMDAAQAAAFIGWAWREPQAQPIDTSASGAPAGDHVTPDEAEAKARLIEAGLPVPSGERAGNAVEAVISSMALGFPVALKALGVTHKSELDAVRLNLRDAESVSTAAHDLDALGTGLYVERMVRDGVAELLVGFTRDPMFGAVMTLGTGGVLVELLRDSVTLMLPATRDDIEAALRRLKLFPLLEGYRGRPNADLAAAIEAISGIAAFVQKNAGEIEELDINPLIVCAQGKGAWIADALLVLGEN
ncbi:acetate--CoA ligase family protein [Mesorhizobium sp.]|uniref:acetate--CoA ligase family protein n=1 Tax=Mesorhizobium sp. TaxID=1871066 RepID=UPI000FE710CC|nr:acetate--CoA ligase family protein [Mesorhizobium sp.]RWO53101.1 MAG: CoA-binding protein [Mesorhizobium sp.]TIN28915.1 MAG: acetate--CoA ligase family protein [Mesorhizobium sp.]TIN37986.1 MAG: acetate--CoA ligase family protein [Mesorhizobium sp.]TJU86487.1 MAG: acetate--CoA ligase family protein [Mesorhizobium sp.]TJU92224.1 MAG: acetate--CoA ligase family protein [Mesorhizobium sp.]